MTDNILTKTIIDRYDDILTRYLNYCTTFASKTEPEKSFKKAVYYKHLNIIRELKQFTIFLLDDENFVETIHNKTNKTLDKLTEVYTPYIRP